MSVQIVWWFFLIVALLLTVIAVFYLVKVVRAARKIESLARRTLPAAVGIASNTSAIKNLETTNAVAGQILNICSVLNSVSGSIAVHVRKVAAILTGTK